MTTVFAAALLLYTPAQAQSDPVQSDSVGLTGTISAPPPSTAATITAPTTGQSFTDVPISVVGLCTDGLLVKVFKNNVFAGSVQCTNGTFEIEIDLFTGTNELVARVFDDLDQPGPDSNIVTVEFVDNSQGAGPRVSVTSNFAKRGADPGEELTWPFIISGGLGPYAISIDWGDGTAANLFSESFPGTKEFSHVYESAGVYNVIIKVTDANGVSAFLQVVSVANGPLSQVNTGDGIAESGPVVRTETRVLWWPILLSIVLGIVTFWLGKRHEIARIKKKLNRGEHPFNDI